MDDAVKSTSLTVVDSKEVGYPNSKIHKLRHQPESGFWYNISWVLSSLAWSLNGGTLSDYTNSVRSSFLFQEIESIVSKGVGDLDWALQRYNCFSKKSLSVNDVCQFKIDFLKNKKARLFKEYHDSAGASYQLAFKSAKLADSVSLDQAILNYKYSCAQLGVFDYDVQVQEWNDLFVQSKYSVLIQEFRDNIDVDIPPFTGCITDKDDNYVKRFVEGRYSSRAQVITSDIGVDFPSDLDEWFNRVFVKELVSELIDQRLEKYGSGISSKEYNLLFDLSKIFDLDDSYQRISVVVGD